MALPAPHSEEPGSLIRAGTERSGCVLEIRGRDESCSRTGPRCRRPLEQHQGPFVRRSHKHKHHVDTVRTTRLDEQLLQHTSSDPAASAANEPLPQTVINAAVGVDRTLCVITGGDAVCDFKDHSIRAP